MPSLAGLGGKISREIVRQLDLQWVGFGVIRHTQLVDLNDGVQAAVLTDAILLFNVGGYLLIKQRPAAWHTLVLIEKPHRP